MYFFKWEGRLSAAVAEKEHPFVEFTRADMFLGRSDAEVQSTEDVSSWNSVGKSGITEFLNFANKGYRRLFNRLKQQRVAVVAVVVSEDNES